MRLLLDSSESSAPFIPFDRKLNGSRPQSRNMEKLCSPLGCPVGGSIFRKNAKTIEKVMTVDSGFSSDHVQPSAERL